MKNTTKAPTKAAARKAAAPMTTPAEIDAALARLAQHPGTTQHFHIELAGTTLNAVRVRILRTPRKYGMAANRIKLVATEGTVVTLQVTNTGVPASPLPASAGGPAPVAKATKATKATKAGRGRVTDADRIAKAAKADAGIAARKAAARKAAKATKGAK